MAMTSNRPYLLRALNQWIIDNQMTPQLVINAEVPAVIVPKNYVNDGKIILNIAPKAVQSLEITNHSISFYASFGGLPGEVFVPMSAVVAIYARETGRGMVFGEDEDEGGPPPFVAQPTTTSGSSTNSKPKLKIVK